MQNDKNKNPEEIVYKHLTSVKASIESKVYIAYFETKAKDKGLEFIMDKGINQIHKNSKYDAIDSMLDIDYIERRNKSSGKGQIQLFRSTPKPFIRYTQEVLKRRERASTRHAEENEENMKFYELTKTEESALISIVNSEWFRRIINKMADERMPEEKLNLKGTDSGMIKTEGAMQFITDIITDITNINYLFASKVIVPHNEIAYSMPDAITIKKTTNFDRYAKQLASKKFKRYNRLVENAFDICARYIGERSSPDQSIVKDHTAFWRQRLKDYGENLYFLCIPKALAYKLRILGRDKSSLVAGINNGIVDYYEKMTDLQK